MNILDMTDQQIVAWAIMLGAQFSRHADGFWGVNDCPRCNKISVARAAVHWLRHHGYVPIYDANEYDDRTWSRFRTYDADAIHKQFTAECGDERS